MEIERKYRPKLGTEFREEKRIWKIALHDDMVLVGSGAKQVEQSYACMHRWEECVVEG